MKNMLYPFMVLAACGLALSIAAHGLALANVSIPGGNLIWGLHIGIFIVWLPTVIIANKMTHHVSRSDFWKVALAGCPVWMRRSLYVLLGYAALNFVVFFVNTVGKEKQSSDQTTPVTVRGFSGHWMIFYGAAFAVLYSRIYAPKLPEDISSDGYE